MRNPTFANQIFDLSDAAVSLGGFRIKSEATYQLQVYDGDTNSEEDAEGEDQDPPSEAVSWVRAAVTIIDVAVTELLPDWMFQRWMRKSLIIKRRQEPE
jgi:hypothetical protein